MLLVILLPIAALWPVCDHAFTSWDDHDTVAANPSLNPVTLHSLETWWTTPRMDLYVPVTYTVWGIIALFAGMSGPAGSPGVLDPVAFHTANLVSHVLACLVVFELLRSLIGKPWPAAAGALLFGLHPMQVEAVAWVSGTKDVLGGLLALAAVWQYVLAVRRGAEGESSRCAASRRDGWRWHYGIATVAFVLAVLAKPNELVAPLIAGVLDVMVLGRSWRTAARWLWPWLLLAAAGVAAGKIVQPPAGVTHNVAIALRPIVAIATIGFYVRKLFWPFGLAADYGLMPSVLAHSRWLIADAAFIVAAATALWLARRSARPMVAGALVFLAALLPVLGFVTFDFQWFSNVADHYLYLPMFGVALMAAWVAARWSGRTMATGAGIVIGALGIVSFMQAQYWADSATLFRRVEAVNPNSAAAADALALDAMGRGDTDAAIHWAEKTTRLRPTSPLGYIADAMALSHDNPDLAIAQYHKALDLDPKDVATRNDLTTLLIRMDRYPEAEALARQDISLDPRFAGAYFNLGVILFKEGKSAGAIAELQKAVAIDPWSPQFRLVLGTVLEKAGRHREALEQFAAARRLGQTAHR